MCQHNFIVLFTYLVTDFDSQILPLKNFNNNNEVSKKLEIAFKCKDVPTFMVYSYIDLRH